MILRLVLLPLLYLLIVRAAWRLIGGILQGATGQTPDAVAGHGVQMVRDPVCGTFVVPSRAVVITQGRTQLFFCSTACRDKYSAPPSTSSLRTGATASGSPRPARRGEPVDGRTA
jgi:uncharacterized protein